MALIRGENIFSDREEEELAIFAGSFSFQNRKERCV
jgi:hypothetical protein